MATNDPKPNATTPATGVDEVKQLKEELKQSKETVADLTSKVSDLQGTIISPQYQEYLNAQKQPPPQTFQSTDFAAGRTGEVDIESMDRKEYSAWLLGEIDKRFTPRIEQVSQNVRRGELQRGIDEARGKHKDFDNQKLAMGKIATRFDAGQFTADDVYKVATWKAEQEAEAEEKSDKTIASEKPTGAANAPVPSEKQTLTEKVNKIWDEKEIDEKFPPPKQ